LLLQAGRQIVEEHDAARRALAAASSRPAVQRRLLDFLRAAVDERTALVEHMLAAQSSGSVTEATLAELLRAERESRLKLMRSLLNVGQEVAALDESELEARTFQDTWLAGVNSLLAIDQVRFCHLICFDAAVPGHVARQRQLAARHQSRASPLWSPASLQDLTWN
jgi:hypothetical protein